MKKILILISTVVFAVSVQAQSDVLFADGFAYNDNCGSPEPVYCRPPLLIDPGLHINEIMHQPHARGIRDDSVPVFPWVEIYYDGLTALNLADVRLRAEAATIDFQLPTVMLPPQSFLTVWMLPPGTGPGDFGLTNDLDFSDAQGTLFQDMGGVMEPLGDDVALYLNGIVAAFLAYGDPFENTTQMELDAIAQDLWLLDSRVPIQQLQPGESVSLVLDGFYDNAVALGQRAEEDFGTVEWQQQSPSIHQQPHQAIQISPSNGSVVMDFPIQLKWQSCDGASDYLLELRNNAEGSDLRVQRIVQTPEYTVEADDVGFDPMYWTVACLYDDEEKASPFAKVWFVATGLEGDAGPNTNVLAVAHEYQRKDSNMLCLYNFKKGKGYACEEAITHSNGTCDWDKPHDVTSPQEVRQCGIYGANNCVRASIQMVHQYRTLGLLPLAQDYISYLTFADLAPPGPATGADPEGDLGAGVGMYLGQTLQTISQVFGINSNAVEVEDDPSFNTIRNWIDADRPVILWRWSPSGSGHSTVIYGYQTEPQRILYVHDPTLGSFTVRYNEYMEQGLSPFIPVKAIVIPVTSLTEIGNPPNSIHTHASASIFADTTDGDGVVNFDEIYRFATQIDNEDSDYDQVGDKQEVYSYTFPLGLETISFRDPDIDGDLVRAELDCNTDNDPDHDGGEDINNNGGRFELMGVGPFETDKFGSSDHLVNVRLDKTVYQIGEAVFMEGGTLHENTNYKTQTIACPGLLPGAGIGGPTFNTNGIGNGNNQVAACVQPGCFVVHLDVADDEIWQHPARSCDISMTFTCESCPPIDDGDDDQMDPDGISPAIPDPIYDIQNLTTGSLDPLSLQVELQPASTGLPNVLVMEMIFAIENPQGILPTQPPQTEGGWIWLQMQLPDVGPPFINAQVWDPIHQWQPDPQLATQFNVQLNGLQMQLDVPNPVMLSGQPEHMVGVRLISHAEGMNYFDVMPEPNMNGGSLQFDQFVDLTGCQQN